MDDVCRICLLTSAEMLFIFYDKSPRFGLRLSAMLQHLTGLNIQQIDGYPELLCISCIDQLESAYDFRESCLKSETYLKENISDSSGDNNKKELSTNDCIEQINTEVGSDFEIDTLLQGKNDSQTDLECSENNNSKNNKTTICDKPTRPYSRIHYLGQYVKSHHRKTSNRKYLCSTCGKGFTGKFSLRQHTMVHQNIKQYSCSFCDLKFRSLYTMQIHERRHTNEKPFICPNCGQRFRSSGNLSIHMRRHTGDLPHICAVESCKKAFAQSSELKLHIQSKHTGERKFQCELCEKNFITKQHLKQHYQRNHEAKPTEKKFACPMCSNKYFTKSSVTKHLKQVHKIIKKNMI